MKERSSFPSCYLAGPMRGIVDYNYPAFMDAARRLRIAGWKVFNPAEMDMKEDKEDYTERTLAEQKIHDSARAARRFAERDIAVLIGKLRAEKDDAIVMLPGWEDSTGATTERKVAIWVKLRVLLLTTALRETHAD